MEEWAERAPFSRWWEAIYPLLGLPVILLLNCAPALLGLFQTSESDVIQNGTTVAK